MRRASLTARAVTLSRPSSYEQIVFSGGGIRCFWHGGWMKVVEAVERFEPARVTGVSGGALSAAAWLGGRERDLVQIMTDAFARTDHNVTLSDATTDGGLTPHQRVYRHVVEALVDRDAEARVADGPAFQILVSRPKGGALAQLTAMTAGTAYELEKKLLARPRTEWPERLGIEAELIDARAAARAGRLADLVCVAATIPPVFEIPHWDGAPACDGAMTDQIPLPQPDSGLTLLLMSRPYDNVPEDTQRLHHVVPSAKPVEGKIDFTDPQKVREAWDLGMQDGRRAADEL